MNKNIFIGIFFAVLISSCTSGKDQRYTNYHYITNVSGKKIVHELICDSEYVQENTFQFYSNGLTEATELEWIISCIVGKTTEHTPAVISYNSFYVYNISDTSSLYRENFFGTSLTYPQYFYSEAGGETFDEKEYNWITNYYLIVNDFLLSLMQKDYGMLDKFKEYYDR